MNRKSQRSCVQRCLRGAGGKNVPSAFEVSKTWSGGVKAVVFFGREAAIAFALREDADQVIDIATKNVVWRRGNQTDVQAVPPSPLSFRINGLGAASLPELIVEREAKRAQGNWYPASGGTEVPFFTRSGRRLLYVWQPSTGNHAYLDMGTDLILSDEEARTALHFGASDWPYSRDLGELDEPEEEDIMTGDYHHWFQSGKLYFTGDEVGLRKQMAKDHFWPNVWFISDHGNAHLIN